MNFNLETLVHPSHIHFNIVDDKRYEATMQIMKRSYFYNDYEVLGQFRIQSVHAKAGVVVRRDNNNDNAIVHFFEMMTEW